MVPASAWLTLARLYVDIDRGSSHALTGDLVLKTLLPIYQQAAAKPPPDVERLTLLAEAYQDLGQNAAALRTLREAVDLEPDNVDVLLRCGRLELALNERPAALKDFEQAYELNPSLSGLREIAGAGFISTRIIYSDAIRLLQDALADSPGNPGLQADLGLAYDGLNDKVAGRAMVPESVRFAGLPAGGLPESSPSISSTAARSRRPGSRSLRPRARFPDSAQVLFYQAIENRYAKNFTAALACLDAMRTLSSSDSEVFDPAYYLENAPRPQPRRQARPDRAAAARGPFQVS